MKKGRTLGVCGGTGGTGNLQPSQGGQRLYRYRQVQSARDVEGFKQLGEGQRGTKKSAALTTADTDGRGTQLFIRHHRHLDARVDTCMGSPPVSQCAVCVGEADWAGLASVLRRLSGLGRLRVNAICWGSARRIVGPLPAADTKMLRREVEQGV